MKFWTKEMPTACGLYEYKCSETDYESCHAAVFMRYDGALMIDDPYGVGYCFLANFHDNLTDLEWKKV